MGGHLKELWAATQEGGSQGSSVDTADFQVTHWSTPHQACPDTSGLVDTPTCFHRVRSIPFQHPSPQLSAQSCCCSSSSYSNLLPRSPPSGCNGRCPVACTSSLCCSQILNTPGPVYGRKRGEQDESEPGAKDTCRQHRQQGTLDCVHVSSPGLSAAAGQCSPASGHAW